MNVSKTTLTLAMTVALGAAGSASADLSQNPFEMQQLESGYVQLAEAKAQDGKCGEGKCGGNEAAEEKAKDGKCGEGKCGDDAAKSADKAKEAKCGEGKCGNKG
jgi:uncharacterized low-complexity protein